MSSPINIFICHKKLLTRENDGHPVEQENTKASILNAILQMHPDKYEPWIDESQIAAGMAWETEIYRRLLVSDVLLVAIGPSTGKSEWVRREIALAKALSVAIVPLGYDLTMAEFSNELEDLDIDHLQGRLTHNIRFPAKDALIQELQEDLERARMSTLTEQAKILATLASRRNALVPKARDKQKAFTLRMRIAGSEVDFHIASGDLTKTRGIDILVNSENDYMQMARVFESRTVSSLLRRRGARVTDGRYEDTIQKELDFQVGQRARPVQAGETFITSTGGPSSVLARENKARYIFHVAAVQALDSQSRVVPFQQPYQIEECMRSCLEKMLQLNKRQGIVSPKGSDQRALQEQFAEDGRGISTSILFPVFGTGQGGALVKDAVRPMLEGLSGFFGDPDNAELAHDLTDVYFAAYHQPDVDTIKQELTTAMT
jgi:O-acetyl-ADP-ribose deacetylase (regulator of RNase III)